MARQAGSAAEQPRDLGQVRRRLDEWRGSHVSRDNQGGKFFGGVVFESFGSDLTL